MNPELDMRWERKRCKINSTSVTQISECNQFISRQKVVLFTVQLMVLLGQLFMFYSYSYDISDHTSNPFFSQDCNGKDSNAIPAVSGWSLGKGGGEEWSKGWTKRAMGYSTSSNSSKLFYASFSKTHPLISTFSLSRSRRPRACLRSKKRPKCWLKMELRK